MKANDVYERTAELLIQQLESADPADWRACWHGAGALPSNATTSAAYRGGNAVALWMAQLERGFASAYWATYRQWSAVGRQVVKGETATYCVKWVERKPRDDAGDGAPSSGPMPGEMTLNRRKLFPVGFAVFHYEQTEPAEGFAGACWAPPELDHDAPDPIEHAEQFFRAIGAELRAGEPAYIPALDVITMPAIERFEHAVGYYGTMAHEHCHWSGAPARLARDHTGRFGDAAYAVEELVAEIGAAMVCAVLGIESEPRPDHARYVNGWIKVLRDDPSALHRAATMAQAAADYLVTAGA